MIIGRRRAAGGEFQTEVARIEETRSIRAVFAERPRLIQKSRATLIEYDSSVSTPEVAWRKVGEPLAPLPQSFGLQSVVAETRFSPAAPDTFYQQTINEIWPWYRQQGARPLICRWDPMSAPGNIVIYVAFRDITHYQNCWRPGTEVESAWQTRNENSPVQSTRLLMVGIGYGADRGSV